MSRNFNLSALLTDIKDSLAGTERDFTTGSIGRAVTILAIPMVLELSMQAVFGVIDVFFVAKLGGEAVATVGITESLLTIVFSIATGLAMGTTALVARRIGERNKQGATTAAVQSIFLGILVSIPIAAIGLLYTPSLLRLMGASPSVVEIGAGYNKVMLGGNLTIMLLFLINAVFRGAGDAALAMRALWIANLVNIVLDPCLIFGLGPFPEMGVTGAAVATNIARAIGILYQIWKLASPASRIQVHAGDFKADKKVLLNLSRISLGGVLQFIVATASWLGLVRIIAIFGSPALAGYTIAIRIIIFAILPSWGMSNAAATLVGQNLGAKQPTRAEKSVWLTAVANMVFLGFITIVFVTFADPISRLFTSDEEILVYAISCLRYVSYGYVFYAYGMVVVQAFNGAGDTYTPTVINLFCYWLLQIPLAYFLALTIGLEAQGVFIAIAVSESLLAVVSVLVFRRGKWKERKV
jgi:putative MATE family efflux protein